tara:strand:+ start:43 stop:825 length:783 start_codon:yes stop_codon:yes gene_type:complete
MKKGGDDFHHPNLNMLAKFNKKTSFAYLMGVYLGDGEIRKKTKFEIFRLNTKDKDFAETTKKAILICRGDEYNLKKGTAFTGKLRKVTLSENEVAMRKVYKVKPVNYFNVYASSAKLFKKMAQMTNNKTTFPKEIFNWTKEERKYFIIGQMDSEGYVAKHNKSKSIITPTGRSVHMGFKITDMYIFKNFLKLLDMSNIKYGKVGSHPTKNKIAYRITIKLQSWIDAGFFLSIKRKQDLIDRFRKTEPYSQRSINPRVIKK